MRDVDELTYDDGETVIDRQIVERQVDDWLDRLRSLFGGIAGWATEHGWSHAEAAALPMHEDLMQQAGVAARQVIGMVVATPSGERVWFKPKALWVIGANGRIDVYARRKSLVLIDVARPFDPPNWVMYDLPTDDLAGRPFSPDVLLDLV